MRRYVILMYRIPVWVVLEGVLMTPRWGGLGRVGGLFWRGYPPRDPTGIFGDTIFGVTMGGAPVWQNPAGADSSAIGLVMLFGFL